MKKVINEMKLQFPSRSANEGFARTAVACFAAQLDPTLDEIGDIKTAVSEAVTNSIVHAYRGMEGGQVYITAKLLEDDSLTVTVRDTGCGIEDIAQARQPCFTTAPSEERSGMGFSIMEAFMDKVSVRSRPGIGTTVTMRKRMGQ